MSAKVKGYYARRFEEVREGMVSRILGSLFMASIEQYARGMVWYSNANFKAENLARAAGLSVDTVAQIIAIISPRCAWDDNLKWARMAAFDNDLSPKSRVIRSNYEKARKIATGTPIEELCRGPKVLSFRRCIADPNSTAVVVDSHAGRIALGDGFDEEELGRLISRFYSEIADAYRAAAAIRELHPCMVQAITWLQHREARGAAA